MSVFKKRFDLFLRTKTINQLNDIANMLEVFYMIDGSYETQLKMVIDRIKELNQ